MVCYMSEKINIIVYVIIIYFSQIFNSGMPVHSSGKTLINKTLSQAFHDPITENFRLNSVSYEFSDVDWIWLLVLASG